MFAEVEKKILNRTIVSDLSGGPLSNKYKVEQFHCHWGCDNGEGSEHTVDGKAYAGEVKIYQSFM